VTELQSREQLMGVLCQMPQSTHYGTTASTSRTLTCV
jgi:hypothetical protein